MCTFLFWLWDYLFTGDLLGCWASTYLTWSSSLWIWLIWLLFLLSLFIIYVSPKLPCNYPYFKFSAFFIAIEFECAKSVSKMVHTEKVLNYKFIINLLSVCPSISAINVWNRIGQGISRNGIYIYLVLVPQLIPRLTLEII
jgi:hypothetical protein